MHIASCADVKLVRHAIFSRALRGRDFFPLLVSAKRCHGRKRVANDTRPFARYLLPLFQNEFLVFKKTFHLRMSLICKKMNVRV